jgi:hypothetical protein
VANVQRSSDFVLERAIGYGFYLGEHDLGMHGVCVLNGIHSFATFSLAPKSRNVVEIIVEITLLELANFLPQNRQVELILHKKESRKTKGQIGF